MFTHPFVDQHEPDLILCYYVNRSSRIQIARIQNLPNWYFERVIFPGERLLFEAPLEAQLEISTSDTVSAVLADKILCQRLQVQQNSPVNQSSSLRSTLSTPTSDPFATEPST